MLVVLGAGGSGGHIFPAIAVAESLRAERENTRILFVGTGNDIERRLLSTAGYPLFEIPFVPVTGGGLKGLLRFAFKLPTALLKGIRLFRRERPAAVFCFGGYPSFIPMLAAWVLRIPRALHEQNVQVGLANKVLSRLSLSVFAAKGAEGFWTNEPVTHLINPVRKAISSLPAPFQPAAGERFTLLIMGGSQGAVTLNDAVLEALPELRTLPLKIIHQAGARDFERVTVAYADAGFEEVEVCEFIDDITSVYRRSNLVIGRAGAMTAAELTTAGIPAIYVPLKIAGGHQKQNVIPLVEAGAAFIEEHGEGLAKRLSDRVRSLIDSPDSLQDMSEKARKIAREGEQTSAERIATAIFELAEQN